MIIVITAVVVAYLIFHVSAGSVHHRYRKAAGLRPNFYWARPAALRQREAARRLPRRAPGLTAPHRDAGTTRVNQRPG